MKVLFIYFEMGIQVYNPLGIGYISSLLKENNHQVSLIRVHKEKGMDKLANIIKRVKPDIVAFSYVSSFSHLVKELSFKIKKSLNVLIAAGGIHPTIKPEGVLKDSAIDFVCVGEGEYAFLELLTKLQKKEDLTNINNVWTKNALQIFKNPVRGFVDLDKLPAPDIDLFYKSPKEVKRLTLMTQRGCPYNCAYCCNDYLNRLYKGKGKTIRSQSLDKVMAEIDTFVNKYPNLKWIHFEDDTFTLDKERVFQFCSMYKKKFNVPFSINSRPELISIDIAEVLEEAGCRRVCIGIESGDEDFRKKYLKRMMSNSDIKRAFRVLEQVGIPARGYLIYGFPREKEENMRNSYNLLKEISPSDGSQVSVFCPFPKTSLYEIADNDGLLQKTETMPSYNKETTLCFSKENKEIIKKYYELSESIHHNSNNDIVFLKQFYPFLVLPYKLFSKIIEPKVLWRFMYRTKTNHLRRAFTFKPGW
ncbi:MAG: radical SAM protein [Candidatus Omnitrophota bacterium]